MKAIPCDRALHSSVQHSAVQHNIAYQMALQYRASQQALFGSMEVLVPEHVCGFRVWLALQYLWSHPLRGKAKVRIGTESRMGKRAEAVGRWGAVKECREKGAMERERERERQRVVVNVTCTVPTFAVMVVLRSRRRASPKSQI
jgi:hypothetical protein